MLCPDGRVRWTETHGVVVRDTKGHPARMIGIDIDVTARRASDERHAWLMSELDHRVRRVLALIHDDSGLPVGASGLGETSSGPVVPASAGGSLTPAHVIAQALEGCAAERISISGPLVLLSRPAAQALTVLLQDLAGHAMEFGALSDDDGSLAIGWRKTADPEPALLLDWTESGTQREVTPNRAELGKRLLHARIVTEFGATVRVSFAAEGLRARLSMPMARVAAAVPV